MQGSGAGGITLKDTHGQSIRRMQGLHIACTLSFSAPVKFRPLARPPTDSRPPLSYRCPHVAGNHPPFPLPLPFHPAPHPTPTATFPLITPRAYFAAEHVHRPTCCSAVYSLRAHNCPACLLIHCGPPPPRSSHQYVPCLPPCPSPQPTPFRDSPVRHSLYYTTLWSMRCAARSGRAT